MFKQIQTNKTTCPHKQCVGSPRYDNVRIYGANVEGPVDLSKLAKGEEQGWAIQLSEWITYIPMKLGQAKAQVFFMYITQIFDENNGEKKCVVNI